MDGLQYLLGALLVLAIASLSRPTIVSLIGQGGGRIKIGGKWKLFRRNEIAAIVEGMLVQELEAINVVIRKESHAKKLELQDKPRKEVDRARPTKQELLAADMAWEHAALRWLRQNPDRARELGVTLS